MGKTIGMLVFSVENCGFIQLSGQTRQQNVHATLSSKGKVYLAWSLDDVSICDNISTFRLLLLLISSSAAGLIQIIISSKYI
jgi:hypothetical protein